MNFEQFDRAKRRDLQKLAKECFDRSQEEPESNDKKISLLLEAQFYMNEMDKRHGGRIAWRDLLLEVVVILLIGFEILLATKQGKNEDTLMDKQNGILSSLQQSTSATASTLQGLLAMTGTMNTSASVTATTLHALELTTKAMNKGVHDQLSLFYDPSATLNFDMSSKKILVTNLGRTAILITGMKYAGEAREVLSPSQMIAPNSGWFMTATAIHKQLLTETPKGSMRTVPIQFYIANENNQKYVIEARMLAAWENDQFVIYMQMDSLKRE